LYVAKPAVVAVAPFGIWHNMMKKFLLRNPSNEAWIEMTEKKHEEKIRNERNLKLIRQELLPELTIQETQVILNRKRSKEAQECVDLAVNRKVFRDVLCQLRSETKVVDPDEDSAERKKKSLSKYNTDTWRKKSKCIFFYLHPQLGNLDSSVACHLFGFNNATFKNWISQSMYYANWIPYVQNFKVKDVLHGFAEELLSKYGSVDGESCVTIPELFFQKANFKKFILVNAGSSEDGSVQKKAKIAAKSKTIIYVPDTCKSIATGRAPKWLIQENYIIARITEAWESGNPLSRASCLNLILKEFAENAEAKEFSEIMKLKEGGGTNYSTWFSRVLERHRFSCRRESISQKIPENWNVLAIQSAELIAETMRKACVTKLVGMDEMFLQFYPKETVLIAPKNSKRVGSNRSEDEKIGCTCVVSVEMFASQVLAPFVVMTGVVDGNLAKKYASWEGASSVNFNPTHWINKEMAKRYIDWLSSCFEGESIGLIWDSASSHTSEDVLQYAQEKGIAVGFIPGGLTSIMQVCDLVVNKPLKQRFKQLYTAYKLRNDPGAGKKVKVKRDDVLLWLEQAIGDFNEKNLNGRLLEKSFKKYGQDFRVDGFSEEFKAHLRSLSENTIYEALMNNQVAIELK
jgi:hypothetical protein